MTQASAARSRETVGRKADAPLFVVGVPRSGTSLLYGLLNQHPQIGLLYEGDLPLLWPMFLKRRSKAEWLERWNFWSAAVERHRVDLRAIPDGISDVKTATETAYRQVARQKGAAIWGCKSPNQYDTLENVAEMFPDARFVILWRDPADVCRSMIRARGMTSPRFRQRGLLHRALFGSYQMAMQANRLRQRGIPVHEVRYEELTANPATELEKICRFLDIEYDPRMASLQGADRSALPPGEHNSLAAGDVVLARREQAEVLPAKFKRKIDRYENLWRVKHAEWALGAYANPAERCTPSWFQRMGDRALYRILRLLDLGVVFVYCFMPLRWLQAYRKMSGRDYELAWREYTRGQLTDGYGQRSRS
jgi:LPS sulfotransferase NodH